MKEKEQNNKAKKTETLVRRIHEALKNLPDTKIYSNYRIEASSGRKREIDVLIESRINHMDIKIAIECKDHKRPVSVDKVEAFHGKCLRIKGISKKVIVSTSGYQADAYEAAKDYDIELYNLAEISKESIAEWFPIKQIKPVIKLQLPFSIFMIGAEEDIKKVNEDEELMVHYPGNENPISLSGFLWNNVVVKGQKDIYSSMLLEFMKGNSRKEKMTRIPFELRVKGLYTILEGNIKIQITRIDAEIVCWYEEQNAIISEARKYEKAGGNLEASVVSVDFGIDNKAEIILDNENNLSIYHSKGDGQVTQLEILTSYDPKTDKFDFHKERTIKD